MRETRLIPATRVIRLRPIVLWALVLWLPLLGFFLAILWVTP
ncbi:hypothetical protein [Sphingomonas nostoxanthinifaciens]|nr:hypothetical protein [Sphingomonas nostoxanthinifaciens]